MGMSMHRIGLVLVLCSGLVLGGCEVDTGPQRIATLRHPGFAIVMPAPYNGRYILYQLVRFPSGITTRDYVDALHLKRGEPLGFRQRAQGAIAIAGKTEISLVRGGNYDWVMEADAGQSDLPKTVGMAASGVLVVAAIAVVVYEAWRNFISHGR